jgi:hypothetical protein
MHIKQEDHPPLTRRERLALSGIALAFSAAMVGALNYLDALGESLPGCPTDPPNAAAIYAMAYLANTSIAHWVTAALIIVSGVAWAITPKAPGLRKLAAAALGGAIAFALIQLMQRVFVW